MHTVASNSTGNTLVTSARLVLALFLVIRFMPNLDAMSRVYVVYSFATLITTDFFHQCHLLSGVDRDNCSKYFGTV